LKSAAAVLLSFAIALALDMFVRYGTFEVKALSVGDGQCFVITRGGKTAVVDCDSRSPGEAYDALTEDLKERNISSIDLLILTCLHTENTSCADELLGSVRIKKLALPFYSGDRDFALALESAAAENKTEVARLTADCVFELGGMNFYVYIPPSDGGARGCAAVLAEYKGAAILVLGELDADSQSYMAGTRDIPELFAVAAGRNGAEDGTSSEILEKYGAKYVIISVGDNSYGIPSETALSEMTAFDAKTLRTDLEGDIVLTFRSGRVGIG
jgi:competence protein ComEC